MHRKPIRYDDHARRQRIRRGITVDDVRWLLAEGIREPDVTHGGPPHWRNRGYLGRHEAAVAYVESAEEIRVITVEWLGDWGDYRGDKGERRRRRR